MFTGPVCSSPLLHRQTHHNARLSRPCQCCHMRLFVSCAAKPPSPRRVGSSTRRRQISPGACGVSRARRSSQYSQPCPAFRCARCGQILLLFRRRSESAPRKVFPAGYPPQRAPLLMTTPHCDDRQRALIAVASPASPDPEPQAQIIARLGCFRCVVRPNVGAHLQDADAGQPANPANHK